MNILINPRTGELVLARPIFEEISLEWLPANIWKQENNEWKDTGVQKTAPNGQKVWRATTHGYNKSFSPVEVTLIAVSDAVPTAYTEGEEVEL